MNEAVSLKSAVSIVLVETQSPGNIGMVCRAMMNMGLTDLRLVNPCRVDHPEALKFAVSARELLFKARIFPTLAEALADAPLSVATTRRHGKYRQEIMTPDEVVRSAAVHLPANRCAFVFGREDSGLTTDEVALCRWQATIPTGSDYGSLNLAQAVLLFCYEIHRGLGSSTDAATERVLADAAVTETMFGQMEETLLRIGFLNPENPAHLMRTFRRIFARAMLDEREVSVIRGMLSQIDWAADNFQGRKGG
ncbi:RNA methyltransferase [Geobacter argillaceus]|uniref:tRNA (cytidine/uridine-2'-O-)-methyltransferase TrmJ n=1 Tax=Geobacter argillaceus TaxID=345631 RepID=A0A562W800_9BACT|nr:RNA methyltransferase [Geobacter argillaceus]TWJ26413.1 tRNA/rRNA methyltransferase [Geobacter argillaceus]